MPQKKPTPIASDPAAFARLAVRLANARATEEEAKRERIEAEEALVEAAGFRLPEGQETYSVEEDGITAKVTFKQPINNYVNSEGWLALRRTLPKDHPARGIFRQKFELVVGEARKLQEANRERFADVSSVITRKPGKIQVDIKSLVVAQGTNN